jgi:hypothetical protein
MTGRQQLWKLLGWCILQRERDTTEQDLRATASVDSWHHAAAKHDATMANR